MGAAAGTRVVCVASESEPTLKSMRRVSCGSERVSLALFWREEDSEELEELEELDEEDDEEEVSWEEL